MRGMKVWLIGNLALAMVLVGLVPASADVIGEYTYTVVADTVLVNKAGGITVSGTLDCTAAVEEVYAGQDKPSDLSVFVNMNWRATQYIGRGKVVTGVWESAVASICYGNAFPDNGTWQTRYPFPSAAIQWVYSQTGKFQAGAIHIELWSSGELPFGEDSYLLGAWAGYDLRAIKTR